MSCLRPILFFALLTITACVDPDEVAGKEATKVRALVSGDHPLSWIADKLSSRYYSCKWATFENGKKIVSCNRSVAHRGLCAYRVSVERIEDRPESEDDVQILQICVGEH